MPLLLEWLGCMTGLLGATLLALNNRYSGYGFMAFLVSNGCWVMYGILGGAWGLIVMRGIHGYQPTWTLPLVPRGGTV